VVVHLEPERSYDEFFAGLAELGETVEIERISI
jgi:hypothetical protein